MAKGKQPQAELDHQAEGTAGRTAAVKPRRKRAPKKATRRRGATPANTGQHRPMADIADPVSLSQAVALTGLSERTIRRRIKAGVLAFARHGRSLYLSRGELERVGTIRPMADTTPASGGQMADTADTERTALAPILVKRIEALERQNEGLHGIVETLNGRLDEQRKLLTAGEAGQGRELAELRDTTSRDQAEFEKDHRQELMGLLNRLGQSETRRKMAIAAAVAIFAAAVTATGAAALVLRWMIERGFL